jgi:hypothetical protein
VKRHPTPPPGVLRIYIKRNEMRALVYACM